MTQATQRFDAPSARLMKNLRPMPELTAFVKFAPNVVVVLELDFTIVAASNVLLRGVGKKEEEIIGKDLLELFAAHPDDGWAGRGANLRASLLRAIESGTVERMPVHRHDSRRPEHEGGGYQERYWKPVIYPVVDARDQITHLVYQCEEVTEVVKWERRGAGGTAELTTADDLNGTSSGEVTLNGDASDAPSMEGMGNAGSEPRGLLKVERDQPERRWRDEDEERQTLISRLGAQARIFDISLSNTEDHNYTFDLEGRITYANRALLDLWRKTADEVIGKNFLELGYPVELGTRLQEQIQRVIQTRARIQADTAFESASGVRHYEYIFVPVLDPSGVPEAVAGSTRDITERKQAEEARDRRSRQLQKVAEFATRINSAHDVNSVIRVITEEARSIIGANQAATSMLLNSNFPQPINVISTPTSRPTSKVVGTSDSVAVDMAIDPELLPLRVTQEELSKDSRWQTVQKIALVVPTENGWLGAPLIGRNGKSVGLVQLADKLEGDFTEDDESILVQLTRVSAIAIENARLYEELRGNDKHKDEFLAMLAHELRNPLAAIGSAVELTLMSRLDQHVDWSLEVITRQTTHLTRIVDDLLDVSRITRGTIELRRGILDLGPIVESAAATVRPLIEERKHTLEVAIEGGELWVNADPTRLEQVLVNLLNNAAKYSENMGMIRLSAGRQEKEVVISVKDRGVGIAPDKLPQMFELFAQGDRSLARSEGGLGIGLTIVKKLVELHGGTVTAASDGPDQGSEFTIRIPASTAPVDVMERTATNAEGANQGCRILVVDDNADTVLGMARLLGLLGHDVATAQSGPEALHAASELRPDCILLDIGLPGMDGYEVAKRLRQDPARGRALIVAISGYGRDEDRRRSREAGFDHHLIKPLDLDALVAVLSAVKKSRGTPEA